MALASILFFIFIYKKVRRTTATGAGLQSNDGSADPDVKIVGQDEKYKRATWGICIGVSIIVGPMLGFALGLAFKLVIPTYYHIEDPTPNGHYTCYAINGNIGKELFGKYVFNNTDEEYYLCRKNYQYGTPDDKTTYVKAIAPHSTTSVPMEIDGWFHPFPTRISYHHGRGPDAVDDHDKICTIFSQSHNLTKYSTNSSRRAFISQSEDQSQLHFTRKQNDIRGKSNGVGIFLIKYL